jgi:two-component system response regulator RegA
MDERSLLIVEDNATMAQVVAGALAARGYSVEHCCSAAEARQRIQAAPPRHMLVDLRLPDGSGLCLVQALRRVRPDARIVVLTGFANIATAIEAIKLGASNYLCKPVDTETIDAALAGRNPLEDADLEEAPQPPTVPDVEAEHILRVLADHSRNISATARALGMHRRTLQRKLSKGTEAH